MKRKAFTMIEIILVIMILSVLFLSFKNIFQIRNKDVVYGQTCVEHLYGEINNFVKGATRSQSIASGTTIYYPTQYLIYMIPSQNTISLQYIASWTQTYQDYQITGNIPNSRYCQTSEYSLILSGSDNVLTINKGLWANAQHQSFRLSWAGKFSLTTDIMLYPNGSITGKHIAQFLIDTRTQAIQKRTCLYINTTGGNCEEWDK